VTDGWYSSSGIPPLPSCTERARLLGAAIAALAAFTGCRGDVTPTAVRAVSRSVSVTRDVPEFSIAPRGGDDFASGVATDGTNALVAFHRGTATGMGSVRAKLFSATGSELAVVNTGRRGTAPFVVFDGANYLMVWAAGSDTVPSELWGQFVSAAGVAVAAPFLITTESLGLIPNGLAFAGSRYLVTYRTGKGDMKGTFVKRDATIGTSLTIATQTLPLRSPLLASDGASRFIAAWITRARDDPHQVRLRTRLIHADASQDTSLLVQDGGVAEDGVSIAYSANLNRYLVVWNQVVSPTWHRVVGVELAHDNSTWGGNLGFDASQVIQGVMSAIPYGTGFFVGWMRWTDRSYHGGIVFNNSSYPSERFFTYAARADKVPVAFAGSIGTKLFFAVNRGTLAPSGASLGALSDFDLDAAVVTP
jgi:hypothetical protein